MKKIKNQIQMLLLLCVFCGCADSCGDDCKTTYLPEVGIGYVFMYDTTNNTSYPVEGAKVTVDNIYRSYGLSGKIISLAINTYTTNAEGLYQVRFVEKRTCDAGALEWECNRYWFVCDETRFTVFAGTIQMNNNQDNIFMLDTIKLYK